MMKNAVLEAIRSRRSTRNFRPDQVEEETLTAILEAGNWAPSAGNDQPWHFLVVQQRALRERMNRIAKEAMAFSPLAWAVQKGQDPAFDIFYGAPTVVVVSCREDALSPRVDCAAAIQNMLLAAESLQVGTGWVGLARGFFAREEEVRALPLPPGYVPFYAVALGYRQGAAPEGPERKAPPVIYLR